MKKTLLFVFSALLAFSLFGCQMGGSGSGNDDPDGSFVQTPSIKLDEVNPLEIGETYQLNVKLTLLNGTVKYESSNEEVISVDEEGLVTAVGSGTATITASIKANNSTYEYSHSIEIEVLPPAVPEHVHTECFECGKCTSTECDDEANKCPGHPVHEHTPCDVCGKCVAIDCDGEESDKCAGHPVHEHTPCPDCGLCTDLACDGTDELKCAGHAVVENGVMELNVTSLGLTNGSYAASTTTVGSVSFEYIELGYYTNGIQMRNKNGNRSQLWNTTAFAGAISKIELTYNSAKTTYDNDSVLIFTFGNAVGEASYTTSLSTVAGQYTYTITPDAAYTFFKLAQNESYTYSMYWDSIVVYYEGGQGSDPVVPEPSVHEHVACPTCGLCTAEDCDGAADVKCAGHEVVTPSVVTSIAEALLAADGTAVELTGIVVSTEDWSTQYKNMSVTIQDENGTSLYVYRLATQVGLGDTITVKGTMATYYETRQVAQGATAEILVVHGDNHEYVEGVCSVCGKAQPAAGEETITMNFASLSAGTQYADETNTFGELTISTHNKGCHFNTQLRIYDSSTNNGYAVISSPYAISALSINMGYKKAALEVYGSVDGTEWVLIESVSTTTTSYLTYNVNVDETAGYNYIKIDAVGAQIRVASIDVTVVK